MDYKKISAGKKPPYQINVIIEIPQGSGVKYELDKKSGAMFVDRFIYTSNIYPFNYGFVPKTLAKDKDPLDVMVISSSCVQSGTVIEAKPIGLLEMEDEQGEDTKIIAVPLNSIDPFYEKVEDISDIDEPTLKRIKLFFSRYKELDKGRWSKVHGFKGRDEAYKEIKKALR